TASANVGLPFSAYSINFTQPAIGDFNHDGFLDVAYGATFVSDIDSFTSSFAQIVFGDGKGHFPAHGAALSLSTNFLAAGYFNGDGKVDIAVASHAGVSILLGNGDGSFQAQKTYSATGPMTGIVQASLRQDGIECLIGIDSASKRFALLPGVGNGTFGVPVFF